ncbi:MAG: helix-turn-helix domain-containing protein [Bacteroidaceae bacterium]|nr:helix-turn-helix domain-containing protein [Bacteroidaceae bacterium]
MRKRNNIFAEAFRWIKKNVEGVKYQKDLAARIGVSEDTITRIMRDQTEVTDDFLCKFNEAFDNVFNYQWLRGEDNEPMLAAELGKGNPHPSAPMIDNGSAINAALAAKDETIETLKARIVDLQRTIADKEEIIKARDERIIALERQLAAATTGDLSRYPFAFGAAEHKEQPKIK